MDPTALKNAIITHFQDEDNALGKVATKFTTETTANDDSTVDTKLTPVYETAYVDKALAASIAGAVAEGIADEGGGGTSLELLDLCVGAELADPVWFVLGEIWLNSTDFGIGTTTAYLEVEGFVTATGLIGEVQLYNITTATAIETISHDSVNPTRTVSAALALTLGNNLYELRGRVLNGTSPAHRSYVRWAGIRVSP